MRIGIDIRSTLKPQRTGIGQYTFNLLTNLARIDHHHRYLLYSRIKPFSHKRNPRINNKNFRFFTERFRHRPDIFFKQVDLFHSSSYDLLPPKGKKFILTIHDVIVKAFPQGHSPETIETIDKAISAALKIAHGVITVSQNTKKDIARWFGFPEGQIKVIHEGAGDEFYPMGEEEKEQARKILNNYGIKEKFILFVGTIEPRKNLETLVRAFQILKNKYKIVHQLIIVGMRGWNTERLFSLVENSGLRGEVIFTGYLPQERINIFYNLADCFVYPSLYEGFGLPIVEAFQTGSAVVTSNSSSCAEIGGNVCLLVNPESIEDISAALFKLVSDTELNALLRKKALKRARDFSWEVAAHKTLNFFQEIYKRAG